MLQGRYVKNREEKQQAREESMSGWDMQHGYFHNPRRSKKYASRGKMWARLTHGRHPNQSFLKG